MLHFHNFLNVVCKKRENPTNPSSWIFKAYSGIYSRFKKDKSHQLKQKSSARPTFISKTCSHFPLCLLCFQLCCWIPSFIISFLLEKYIVFLTFKVPALLRFQLLFAVSSQPSQKRSFPYAIYTKKYFQCMLYYSYVIHL